MAKKKTPKRREDMSEPLERLRCQMCGNEFNYGGPKKLGYSREVCGAFCDGRAYERSRIAGPKPLDQARIATILGATSATKVNPPPIGLPTVPPYYKAARPQPTNGGQ